MEKLTPKQQRFIDEYLIDLNATQAAVRSGYSKKTAEQQGSRLLSNAKISAKISERRKVLSDKAEITQERVIAELAKIGFSDIRAMFENGLLKGVEGLPDNVAGAVSSIEIISKPGVPDADGNREVEHVHKVRLWDKLSALEKIGKHLGMFDGNGGGEDDALPVTVTIGRRKAVGSVRVTGTE